VADRRKLARAIARVVAYLWDDELKDCREASRESAGRHIFRSLVTIRNFLEDDVRSVDSWLADV
jgi:hypothetical protein